MSISLSVSLFICLYVALIVCSCLEMCGIDLLFRFSFGSVFEKDLKNSQFGMSLVWFGKKKLVHFGYYSYLLLV